MGSDLLPVSGQRAPKPDTGEADGFGKTGIRLHKELSAIWDTPPGWGRLAAVNHTTLGKRFMLTAFVFFLIGGLLGMLIRAQLATSDSAFVGAPIYNQIFTMHGTIMMFLFAIPMFEGFAIYLLPKMLGARDMAFPRLTAYGYWCYLFGGSILIFALLAGVAPDGGWFMYTPLNSRPYAPGINADIWLLGITFVEISALSAAIEIVVSILRLRAPGMSIDRMPIMAWYLLVTAFMMLFGFPPLILGSILLELERAFDLPFFDSTRGGDSLLWQHLFWLFGHPEVYIIFLPAAGAVSMMIPTFARHELVGYRTVILAVMAVGFLSFGLWVHHMFTVGIPHLALAFFSAASGLVAIPTAVQLFSWIGTIAQGRPRFDVPMLYLGGAFFIFVLGGLTGVMLAMVPFNFQAHDTHFVVAHLHYVLVGGFVFPLLAATYYWLPHITGRMARNSMSVPAFWLIFGGFNLTFLVMHLTGLLGMPRRVWNYPAAAGWDMLNLVSSIGSFVMAVGFALFAVDILLQFRFGERFRRNPWAARTLEWATPTPPPSYAFASLPVISDRADRLDPDRIGADLAAGRGYLGVARNGWMETLAVDMASGAPREVVILPKPTFLPFWTGLTTGAFVLCLLAKAYMLSLLPLLATLTLFLVWTAHSGSRKDLADLPIGRGQVAPPHWQVERPSSWWAMTFTLAADGVFFSSLLFGALFLRVVAPGFATPLEAGFDPWLSLGAIAAAWLAAFAGRRAVGRLASGRPIRAALASGAVAQVAATALLIGTIGQLGDLTVHASRALLFALLAYAALHCALGAIFAAYGLWRDRAGFLSRARSIDLRLGMMWHAFTAFVVTVAFAASLIVSA